MKRTLCVVTTSRADAGLLSRLLKEIQADRDLRLQIIASGMHLAPEFGFTYQSLEDQGFVIDRKVEMLVSSDTDTAAVKSLGLGLLGFADALAELRPEIIVLLGDRYELLAAGIAALLMKIPIAHIHGGETSQGVVDEAVRHSLTKMASFHFPATEEYRRRIIQLGEDPRRVFNFGAPGLDDLVHADLLSRKELGGLLQFKLDGPLALVTYHPVTLEKNTAEKRIRNILSVIDESGIRAVFTESNADSGGRIINQRIEQFCGKTPDRFRFIPNLGRRNYLSCLKHVDLMIGNSSSGLIEAPSFQLPVVNIGDRQKGRIKASNVISVDDRCSSILKAVQTTLLPEFKAGLRGMRNPYQRFRDGSASRKIKDRLKLIPVSDDVLKKEFHDLPWHD